MKIVVASRHGQVQKSYISLVLLSVDVNSILKCQIVANKSYVYHVTINNWKVHMRAIASVDTMYTPCL